MQFQSSCASCFAGLSCGTRINIIGLLQNKNKMNVSEITRHFQVSQPTISHHLKYLLDAKILKSEKEGRQVFYRLHPKCDENMCKLFT